MFRKCIIFSLFTTGFAVRMKLIRGPDLIRGLWFGEPWANALSRACCGSTTKHYDKTVVLWQNTTVRHCDRTKCHIYKTWSSRYKKG